jgi:hypothetical protein
MKYEIWECLDENGERIESMMSTQFNVIAMKNGGMMDEGFWTRKCTIEAETYDDAATKYHEVMEFEPYVPMQS